MRMVMPMMAMGAVVSTVSAMSAMSIVPTMFVLVMLRALRCLPVLLLLLLLLLLRLRLFLQSGGQLRTVTRILIVLAGFTMSSVPTMLAVPPMFAPLLTKLFVQFRLDKDHL